MAHTVRTLTDSPEPKGLRETLARHALLPLRLFLGVTFIYAGLDKLTDANFLDKSGTGSFAEQLDAYEPTAGFSGLIDLAQNSPQTFAWAILLGEIAVGIGALLGLFTRIAALGGALISLTFLLTVSWSADPYYLGQDLPYLMAWIPLILAGAPTFSADAALRKRRGRFFA